MKKFGATLYRGQRYSFGGRRNKIVEYQDLDKLLKIVKTRTIVLAGGCFDILHLGHIRFLKEAKKTASVLIVALESDKKIKNIKGKCRPLNSQNVRAEILSTLSFIDYIILLWEMKSDKDYQDLILKIKPKVIAVTKGDLRLEKKKKQAKAVKAKVIEVVPYFKDYSTTKILGKVV